ncbi:MAG: SpoIID/LytB domain-containing protein [Clostridia bacterium]|nr:SpoIID/LytB domain-containing protein [Clostridia bacterium]
MSKKQAKKKKFRADNKFWVRLLCAFLAALMVLGAAAIIIQIFADPIYAVSDVGSYYHDADGQLLVSVGLMYADGVTVGFETSAKYGFNVGYSDSNRHFNQLATLSNKKVAVVCDGNLSKSSMTYSLASYYNVSVGGWHIQVDCSESEVYYLAQALGNSLGNYTETFPAVINGSWCLRIGQYSDMNLANGDLYRIQSLGYNAHVVSPSDTALCVIDPSNDDILFEYDGYTNTTLALSAAQNGTDKAYLVTPAQNTYDGFFKYTRWISQTASGVAVTNILPLDDYVRGVLPWEVSNQSSQNLLRTFAVASRSFALSSRKHNTFDICNTTCCQVYKGLNRTNDAVNQAVDSTAGMILAYGGKAALVAYSSSTGGGTVAAKYAWGTDTPYLQSVITPWEDYENVPGGSWTVSMTPSQIMQRLTNAGYTGLNGTVVDVSIEELAGNSNFVYELKITDSYGSSVTITRTDKIRTVLGLKSANFVVGRAGETLTVTDYEFNTDISAAIDAIKNSQSSSQGSQGSQSGGTETQPTQKPNNNIFVDEEDITYGAYVMTGYSASPEIVQAPSEAIILTHGDGIEINFTPNSLSVLTDSGLDVLDITNNMLIFDGDSDDIGSGSDTGSSGGSIFEDTPAPPTNLPDITAPDIIVKTERQVVAEGDPGSFVFVGRGYGHGIGLSQYGVRDLVKLGYDYETILTLYLPGTYITHVDNIIAK